MADDLVISGNLAGGIKLPAPRPDSHTSIEAALLRRRSVREFRREALSLTEVSQLLWATQGITDPEGKRTAPSAGALYPLEVFLVMGEKGPVPTGVYRYRPQGHDLACAGEGDRRMKLARAALDQNWLADAPITIVIAAVYERTVRRYRQRGERYVHMDAGHAAQNLHLQAVALALGTVVVGAFDDAEVKRVLSLAEDEQPLCLMPVGRPNQSDSPSKVWWR
jgi:SagB-type dehydrogenase family enzyme